MQAKNMEKHIKQFNINLNHVLSGYWKTKAIQNRKNIAKLWLSSKDFTLGLHIMNRPDRPKDRSHNYMETAAKR